MVRKRMIVLLKKGACIGLASVILSAAAIPSASLSVHAEELNSSVAAEEPASDEGASEQTAEPDSSAPASQDTAETSQSSSDSASISTKSGEIYPTQISLLQKNLQLTTGDKEVLKVNGYSGNATNKEVTWSSSDPTVASVDPKTGEVTAVSEGTAVITATCVSKNEGQEAPASDSCTVKVIGLSDLYKYTTSGNSVTITDYLGEGGDIVIPSTIEGKPVTALGPMSFWMDDNITSVVIPEGVTSIGKQTFNGDDNLSSITLPSTLTTIGQRAFWGTAITEIAIPEGVTSLGNEAFSNCTQLSKATLPSTLVSVGANAFSRCTALKEISLPDHITYVGTNAFGTIETINTNAGTTTTATLDKAGIDYTAVVYPTAITLNESELELTQGETDSLRVNSYSANATNRDVTWSSDNESVATVAADGTVTAVGEGTAVITATCVGKNEGQEAPASAQCTVTVIGVEGDYEYSTTEAGVIIEGYTGTGKEIVIPPSIAGKPVVELGAMSFWMNDDITSVVIPEGVTAIRHEAFNGDNNLAKVTLPSTLKTIERRAFWGTAITKITIPEGVTSLGNEAFNDCDKLKTVSLPSTLTSVGANVFASCDSLTELTLPDNISYIGTNAFKSVGKLWAKNGSTTAAALDKAGIKYSSIVTITVTTEFYNKDGSLSNQKGGTSTYTRKEGTSWNVGTATYMKGWVLESETVTGMEDTNPNPWKAEGILGDSDVTIKYVWREDNLGPGGKGDSIPDQYQIEVSYAVENGAWNDGTSDTVDQLLTLTDENGAPTDKGTVKPEVPEVGNKPNEGYTAGSWSPELKEALTAADNGTQFVYSYAESEPENPDPENPGSTDTGATTPGATTPGANSNKGNAPAAASTNPAKTASKKSGNVKTGDTADLALAAGLLVLSGSAAAGIELKRRRRED